MPTKIDLNELVNKNAVELGAEEHPDDRDARLRREERRDQREHMLFYVVPVGIVLVAGVSIWFLLFADSTDAETRGLMRTVLTSILAGSVAFLFGRHSRN